MRPGRTSTAITQEAARQFAEIAATLRGRGLDPAAVAYGWPADLTDDPGAPMRNRLFLTKVAYGWPADLTDNQILEKLLERNQAATS